MSELNIVIGTKTYSSWSLRGWLAVAHTGIDYSETMLPLDTPDFHEKIGELSPTRCVPVLHHDTQKIWDSLAIIDYCSRLAPHKNWWPENLKAFGMARSISAEMHSGFTALRSVAPMNFRDRWTDLTLSGAVQKDVTRIDQIWQECRRDFGQTGDFLFGDFGAADMMYAPVVSRFQTYGIKPSSISQTYMQNVLSHPLIKQWIAGSRLETQIVAVDQIASDATHLG